jgi:hypothetical protein
MSDYLKAITAAFKAEIGSNNKIVAAAQSVAAAHPRLADITPEIEVSIKAAIANALPAAEYALFSTDKKAAKDFDEGKKARRAAAQRYVSNAFKRLIGYAYPAADSPVEGGDKAEAEGEATAKSASPEADKWAKRLSDLIAQAQKASPENVDVAGFVKALQIARTFVVLTSAK